MRQKLKPISLALLVVVGSGCAGLGAPPTTLTVRQPNQHSVGKSIEVCGIEQTQTVQGAAKCATELQNQYGALAIKLLTRKGQADVGLLSLSSAAVGVTAYQGRSEITRGLGLIGGAIFGFNTYIDRKKIGINLLNSAAQMQCLAAHAANLETVGAQHQEAMKKMHEQYLETEESALTEAEIAAFDAMYGVCGSTDAASASGGYGKTEASRIASMLMTRVRVLDLSTVKTYYETSRDVDAAIAAFAKAVTSKSKQETTMGDAAKSLEASGDAAPKNATDGSALVRSKNKAAVDEVLTTTKQLHALMIDLDSCVTTAGGVK